MKRIFLILILLVPLVAFSKGLKPYMFQLKDENGNTIKLEQLKGNVVYLIFWSKTCHTCKEELPQINKLYKKFKNKKVKFFAVVIDEKNPDKIKKIKEKWGFDIPVLLGDDTVKSKYRIIGTPITYILRKDLTIGKIIYGAHSLKKLEKYINKFLEEER